MEYHERLKKLMKDAGIGLAVLEKACGVSNGAVSQWRSGMTKPKDLVCIAKAVNWSTEDLYRYLEQGISPPIVREPPAEYINETLINTGIVLTKYTMVPVIGMARLGDDGYFINHDCSVGHDDGHIDHPTTDPKAYALKTVGDSMFPTIRHGWYIVIEPNLEPYDNMLALVKLKDGRSMIREVNKNDDGFYTLLSVSTQQDRITLHQDEVEDVQPVGGIIPPNKVSYP